MGPEFFHRNGFVMRRRKNIRAVVNVDPGGRTPPQTKEHTIPGQILPNMRMGRPEPSSDTYCICAE